METFSYFENLITTRIPTTTITTTTTTTTTFGVNGDPFPVPKR